MSNLSLLSSIVAQLAPDTDNATLHTGSKRTRQVKEWFEDIVASAIASASKRADDADSGSSSKTPDLAFTR